MVSSLHPVELVACLFGLIAIFGTVFWIWMIVDCARNEPDNSNDKIVWILVIVLTHLVGALIYFFVRRPTRKSTFGR
ncbi:MAG TPA: PLD nuclease N-terminal domain-containing protein [Ktedonobacteraceae bacterium]